MNETPLEPKDRSLPETDRPIVTDKDDRFGRGRLADAVAADVSSGSGSLVAAVIGPWGSGKTSVLHLVRSRLKTNEVVAIDFNPWLFAGTDQLIQSFFVELVAQLSSSEDMKIREAASRIQEYSELLDPLAELPGIGGILRASGKGLKIFGRKLGGRARFHATSVQAQRIEIEKALAATNKRFVVFIDDIDRLEQDEVRDVVRLVRLVADFPRVSYLLAFDRQRVEEALGRGDAAVGRDYLEKIVQVSHPLPIPDRQVLRQIATGALDTVIDGSKARPLDETYWRRVFLPVIDPLLRTPRDVVRYSNGVRGALRALGEEVNLVDVLALEAYRVLMPEIVDRLARLTPALTTVGSGFIGLSSPYDGRQAEYKAQLEQLVASAGERSAAVAALLKELFPATQQFLSNWSYGPDESKAWRRERRVASLEVFGFYLTHTLPPGSLPAALVELAFASLADRGALESVLARMTDEELGPLLNRLEDFEYQFPDDPTGAIIALANLRPRLPPSGPVLLLSGGSAELRLDRVLLRLERKVEPEARREEVLRAAFPEIQTLSARMWLVFHAGHRENVGSKLISEAVQSALEDELRQSIRSTAIAELARERDLLRLLHFLKEAGAAADQALVDAVVADDGALAGLLASGLSEESSESSDGTVTRTSVLPWKPLEDLVAAGVLEKRVASLNSEGEPSRSSREREAVEVGKRYAGGWRPKPFGEDD